LAELPKVLGMSRPFIAISATLAMASLQEASDRVSRIRSAYEDELREAIADRDELIVDAVDAGVPITRVQKQTGLSRERIRVIRNRGEQE
jgi:hypothetical protein